jgi:hypothetical protein
VIDHIGATIYTNRTTGKIALKLIREVADTSTLPLFEPGSGLLDVREAPIVSTNYVNEVKLTYRDPISDEDRVVKVDNLASLQASQGVFNSVAKSYPGIPTAGLATRVAQRDLRTMGVQLRKFTLVLDRRAWDITPGDAIRVRDLMRGIRETVVRIGRYEDGTLTDGKITVTALQDMFALPDAAYVEQQPIIAPPSLDPCVGRFELFEMPYALLARVAEPGEFAAVTDDQCYFGTALEQGRSVNLSYQLAVRAGLPEAADEPAETGGFCGYEEEEIVVEWRLAGGVVGLETQWYLAWQSAQAELLENYNVLNGPGFTVDRPNGYPVMTPEINPDGVSQLVPVKTRFRRFNPGFEDVTYSMDMASTIPVDPDDTGEWPTPEDAAEAAVADADAWNATFAPHRYTLERIGTDVQPDGSIGVLYCKIYMVNPPVGWPVGNPPYHEGAIDMDVTVVPSSLEFSEEFLFERRERPEIPFVVEV